MHTYLVTAWLPVQTLWFDGDCGYVEDTSAIDRILPSLPDVIPKLDSHITHISAQFENPSEELTSFLKERNRSKGWELYSCISLAATVSVDPERLSADNPGQEFGTDILMAIAATYLADAIEKVLLVSEIAEPGGVATLEGTTTISGRIAQPIRGKEATRALRCTDPEDPCWPPLSQLDLSFVFAWLNQIGFLSERLATTRIQRVLASYTHVIGLTSYREGEVLFRAMQGLEAFYCDGIGDLRRQLGEKVGVLLGPWHEKKNIVGHLYDLRSKFVHGSAHIEYWNQHDEVPDRDEKYLVELAIAASFAVRLLIATLQRCASEGITEFRWRYALEAMGQEETSDFD